jgi:DNA-directed RNA polymerase specialized sigma subunit
LTKGANLRIYLNSKLTFARRVAKASIDGRLRKKSSIGKARTVQQTHRDRKQACPELIEGKDEAQSSIWTFYEAVKIHAHWVK